MNDLKICVYAICKNEEKFVDRWISSLINEADYIVVLDTGSTDSTVEKLKKYSPKVRVEQKIITPWRFDVARNESMKLIPKEADICCVADLDQIWRPGWGEAIRDCFRKGITEPCGDIINYAEDGSEEGRITSRNVHPNDPDYWWERPIHEGLYYHGTKDQPKGFSKDFVIEHRQDKSKSRGGYLGLLEAWYKEEIAKLPEVPLDPYCAIYYGCELGFHGREESHQVFLDSLKQCDFSKNPEILYQTYLNISAYYEERNDLFKALDYAKLAKNETGISTRKVYCKIGELLNKLRVLDEAIKYYEKALTIHPDYIGWEEDRRFYEPGVIEFDLAIICYYNKDYEKAYRYGQIAYSQLQTPESYENLQFYVNALNNDRKVCVYAICKNEDYNIRKWFNCVKDANAVVILDTGSTDKTWDILEELSCNNNNLHIFRKEYDDLNFSKMRNDCLALTDSFTYSGDWILVNLDLDEFLEDHGIELIRVRWKSEYDCMNLTGITSGSDSQVVFRKIHSSTAPWYWKRRVHETLSRADKKKKDWVVGNSEVSYTHIQNTSTKHRNYYELLQKENEENPGDELTLIYLSWEAFLHNEIEKALEYNRECLELFHEGKVDLDDDFPWEKEAIKMQACLNLANYEEDINKRIALMEECLSDIDKGLFYPCRRIYMEAADIYWSANLKEKSISLYKKALNVRTEPSIWFNAKYEDSDIFSKLGIACYYVNDVISALNYGLLAKDMVNVNIYYRPKYREIYGEDYPLIYQGLEGSPADKPEISGTYSE